ncbi:MAG: methyltransferase domain-containing protein [Chroococcidiopsidaceae cyanobacterium CP_BM_ER_R8_30]|nr:methyltransferase domain-containing protein [Chroococcidiopsidaceae cyanobacterium CP_BM_ER_R8_30]
MLASTKSFAKDVLPSAFVRQVQKFLFLIATHRLREFDLHLNFPDRHVLEDIIIPYFVKREEYNKILFVGCDWYTRAYKKYFKKKNYWTIEIDKEKRKYGAKKHISDSVEKLSDYVDHNYFDLIFCTGVFGHGMNSRETTEKAINQCFQCLREGGILVFSWNDIPERKPFSVTQECQSLKKFNSYFFTPLSSHQYTVNDEMRHTFVFYIKPQLK